MKCGLSTGEYGPTAPAHRGGRPTARFDEIWLDISSTTYVINSMVRSSRKQPDFWPRARDLSLHNIYITLPGDHP